jgi:hypothetical protein
VDLAWTGSTDFGVVPSRSCASTCRCSRSRLRSSWRRACSTCCGSSRSTAREALLTIETPVRSVTGGRDFADLLFADQADLQTQVFLLKRNRELAQQTVARLAASGVNLAGGRVHRGVAARARRRGVHHGHAGRELLADGPDKDSLPAAVNAYAATFKEASESKSARQSAAQEQSLQSVYDAAEATLKTAQEDLAAFVAAHKDLNLAAGENPASTQYRELQTRIPDLEVERDRATKDRATTLAALARCGATAAEPGYEIVPVRREGRGGTRRTVARRRTPGGHAVRPPQRGLPALARGRERSDRRGQATRRLAPAPRDHGPQSGDGGGAGPRGRAAASSCATP